jgi:predicted acyltransferase
MTPPGGRRTYLDVMRGLAVLIMIEAHVIDGWTRVADRANPWFGRSLILGGFGAPLFLLLAGVAIPLSAASKARRLGEDRAAARAVVRRGLEIFVLAFLFRFQAFVISQSSPRALLKVDILNIMGPAIIATAWLWGAFGGRRARLAAFAAVTAALAFATPVVRAFDWLAALPDFIEGYIRPVPGITNFAIFPWAAFVPAGACAGLLIEEARDRASESRLLAGIGTAGVVLALAAYAASYLPSPYARSNFWTSSPAFFFLRLGAMLGVLGLAYLWDVYATRRRWRPLEILGRSSLFVYWIHVEMVYGIVSLPLHGAMSLGQAWLALLLFSAFILVLTVAKNRFVRWWKTRGYGAGGRASPLLSRP